ncbi:MAG: helicase-exonuclease AddAB subunit AddA [Lachnospiraceae bacterium]|nr:helicase-exonuclease AddAB subunit AddA [Lachnospiraceae bacterium]
MAEFELSKAQQQVVDAKDCSLLVAAAAGSGKTAVLVKRIIERIRSGQTSIDRLLIVTFTNAAAAEMKERIGKTLREEMAADPENKVFKEQFALLSEARISTIDSFCNFVVRENFQMLNIDPGFSVMEPAENELIKSDVLDELFEEEYETAAEDFLTLVSAYGEYKKDDKVRDLVMNLLRFAENEPRPEEWLNTCISDFGQESHDELLNAVYDEFVSTINDVKKLNAYCTKICSRPEGCVAALDTFENDRILLEELTEKAHDYDSAVKALSDLKWSTFKGGNKPDEDAKKEKERVKGIRDGYKKTVLALRDTFFSCDSETAEKVYARTFPALSALVRITLEFMKRVNETKREKNAFSFADIEHMALTVLCEKDASGNEVPTAVARELADRFDEIMIDEYQDSSFMQEYMLKSISGEFGERIPNLFMVGDVKQSIYSFRQARPELFENKYEEFKSEGLHRKIVLSQNFRSRKSVLDAVNVLLAPVMKKDMTEIEYDEAAALHFGSKSYLEDDPLNPAYNTELILIDKKLSDVEEDESDAEDDDNDPNIGNEEEPEESIEEGETNELEREALTVAKKIYQMIAEGYMVSDSKSKAGQLRMRPVQPGDFAVLTRNGKKTTEAFVKALNKMSIPTFAETGTGFFNAIEIRKTLSFLSVLDNPYDDIAFAAALYSPYACFGVSDLADLKLRFGKNAEGKTRMLYEAVKKAANDEACKGDPDSLTVKAAKFVELLEHMRALNETLTVHELINAFFEKTGYKNLVTVMPNGEARRGNLELLVSLAEKYEKSSFAGLHDFLRYIERLKEKESDFGEAEGETCEDSVVVTTMHKSKGLEFPVVFACRLSSKFNLRDSNASVMMDRDLGLASNLVDRKKRLKKKTLKQIYLRLKSRQKTLAEEVRVLYVALTRAKEKLFMVASVDKTLDVVEKYRNSLLVNESPTYTDLKKYGCLLDFVGPTLFSGLSDSEIERLEDGESVKKSITRHAGTKCYTSDFGFSPYRYRQEEAAELSAGMAPIKQAGASKEPWKSFLDEPGVKAEIEAQKNFVYPGLEKAKAPMRVSVSALKHIEIENLRSAEEGEAYETPLMKNMPVNPESDNAGALRGTLYHEVFEKLRYEGDYSSLKAAEESVKADVKSLISDGFLEADILDTVKVHDIAVFCMSGIGKRMIEACRSGKLHREQPFVYRLSPEEYRFYSKTEDETDSVMVQGIIDAYIDTGDTIVLIDYKTDKVKKDADEELKAKYHVQLDLYAKALEAMTRKKVSEKVIYSVTAGKDIFL